MQEKVLTKEAIDKMDYDEYIHLQGYLQGKGENTLCGLFKEVVGEFPEESIGSNKHIESIKAKSNDLSRKLEILYQRKLAKEIATQIGNSDKSYIIQELPQPLSTKLLRLTTTSPKPLEANCRHRQSKQKEELKQQLHYVMEDVMHEQKMPWIGARIMHSAKKLFRKHPELEHLPLHGLAKEVKLAINNQSSYESSFSELDKLVKAKKTKGYFREIAQTTVKLVEKIGYYVTSNAANPAELISKAAGEEAAKKASNPHATNTPIHTPRAPTTPKLNRSNATIVR